MAALQHQLRGKEEQDALHNTLSTARTQLAESQRMLDAARREKSALEASVSALRCVDVRL